MEKSLFTVLKFNNSPYPAWAAPGQTLKSKLVVPPPPWQTVGRHGSLQQMNPPACLPVSLYKCLTLSAGRSHPSHREALGLWMLWDVAPSTSQGMAASLRPNSPSAPPGSSQPHLTPLMNCFSFHRTSPHSDDWPVTGFTGFFLISVHCRGKIHLRS